MTTNLIGLKKNFPRKNWSGYWEIDGHKLSNSEAHKFVDMAIAAGYKTDAEVPDELVRKWLGLKGGNNGK